MASTSTLERDINPSFSEAVILEDPIGELKEVHIRLREKNDATEFLMFGKFKEEAFTYGGYTYRMLLRIKEHYKVPRRVESASVFGAVVSRVLDTKTGKYISVLKVPRDVRFLDETEGLLAELNKKLKEEGMDTPDLVKKAWKTSE